MKDLLSICHNAPLTVVQPAHTIISFIKWAVEERMRFILVLRGQTGLSLFFRLALLVDIGGDKSSWIDTSFSSHWFAHTTSPSSHLEVLPTRWPLYVAPERCSFISLRIEPIHFADGDIVEWKTLVEVSWCPVLQYIWYFTDLQFFTRAWNHKKHNSWYPDRKPNQGLQIYHQIHNCASPSRATHTVHAFSDMTLWFVSSFQSLSKSQFQALNLSLKLHRCGLDTENNWKRGLKGKIIV